MKVDSIQTAAKEFIPIPTATRMWSKNTPDGDCCGFIRDILVTDALLAL